jgi:flavin reductase (DIM6/NTAB) family NADH-FMN oxidoreductase RutF
MNDIDKILRLLDREIWLITATHNKTRAGLIATFVSNASIVPELPRMVIGIAKQHYTWSVIEASRTSKLHLLDESQIDMVWRFGLQSGHTIDKFAGLQTIDAVAWMQCNVEASLDSGDRTIYLGEVVDGHIEKSAPILTLRRVLELAPPERLAELREGMKRDALVDAAAILDWRRQFV